MSRRELEGRGSMTANGMSRRLDLSNPPSGRELGIPVLTQLRLLALAHIGDVDQAELAVAKALDQLGGAGGKSGTVAALGALVGVLLALPRVDRRVAGAAENAWVGEALADLQPEARIALVLACACDLGDTDIAEVMGCPVEIVRGLLVTAVAEFSVR